MTMHKNMQKKEWKKRKEWGKKEENPVSVAVDAVNMVDTSILIGISVAIFLAGVSVAYAIFENSDNTSNTMNQNTGMMGGTDMMSGMMSQVTQDVIVKVKSSQKVSVGKEAEIVLLVLDKENEKPLTNAEVIIGIERGSSMSTMDMMGSMFEAENIGSGKYVVRFSPDSSGIYTMHTHVIPSGKSMHSMMNNHLDIGIIAE